MWRRYRDASTPGQLIAGHNVSYGDSGARRRAPLRGARRLAPSTHCNPPYYHHYRQRCPGGS